MSEISGQTFDRPQLLSYPLSSMQQGMLFHCLHHQQQGVDSEQLLYTLPEIVDLDALEWAWQQVLQRYPNLSVSFNWQHQPEPVQQVHPQVQIPHRRYDWRNLPATVQTEQFEALLEADRQHGFDCCQPPLMRLTSVRLAEARYQIVWTFHHILLDGRSLPIVLREWLAFYQARCRRTPLSLPQSRPFWDYIEWRQQQDWDLAQDYWQSLLAGFTTPTPLPCRTTPTSVRASQSCGVLQMTLGKATTAALRSLAHRHQLTPNTFLQGAWALVLNAYSRTDDVVFGATRACRHSGPIDSATMVGLLINTLPVRVTLTPDQPLLDWLQHLRQQHLAIRPYEHTPLDRVQDWSQVTHDQPLFKSIVVYAKQSPSTALQAQIGDSWPHLQIELREQPSYPLVLAAYLESDLLLKLYYDPQQFDPATIDRLLAQLKIGLEQMIINPNQTLGQITLLTLAEQQQLAAWNDTDVAYPSHYCLHHLFEHQVERTPEAIAVTIADQTLTYGELNRRANQLAHYLQTLGVKPEVPVGLCIERSLEMVVALLAVLKAGGAYVPLDPTYPQERLTHMVTNAQITVVLTQAKFQSLLPAQALTLVCLDSQWAQVATAPTTNPGIGVTSANLAYIIYTSGSTGKPKGVLIDHRGAVNTILDINRRFQVGPDDRGLAVCSLNFDLSVYDLFGLLAAGGTVVLPQPSSTPDPQDWINTMVTQQVTLWNSAPPMMQMVAGYMADHQRAFPTSLRLVMLSGDWIPLTLPDQIRSLRPGAGNLEIVSLGGATEASIWSILYPIEAVDPTWRSIPYGRPLANQQFHILNDQLQPVPMGEVGELFIGGDGVARGYHNRPDLNATRFFPDPFRPQSGGRLYRTGDLGRYCPDGVIEFLGRIDHQVKIRGFRIEIGEIETVLVQQPLVREVAVLAQEDGAGSKYLVAYLVPHQFPAGAAETEVVRAFLQQHLPDYMVPAGLAWIEALPITANGKLDRKALLAIEIAPPPPNRVVTAPRNPIEQQLVEIWQDSLGVQPIGIGDNFFELGGNSLLAVGLWSQIEQRLATELPLATLFQFPTIQQLAQQLQQADPTRICPSLVVVQAGQSTPQTPPLFCIHVLGHGLEFCRPLVRYWDGEYPVYGLSTHVAGEAFPSNRVEDLAAHYIQQMRTLQPEGPYLLVGVSHGGIVALEMAQQLVQQRQQVAFLGILDTRLAHGVESAGQRARWQTHRQNLLSQGPSYVMTKLQDGLIGRLQQQQDWLRSQSMKLQIQLHRLLDRPLNSKLHQYVCQLANEQSAQSYTPQTYPGNGCLFRAMDNQQRVGHIVDATLGWSQIVEGYLDIHAVPGSHLGMLQEPNVQQLSKQLQICIARSLEAATTTNR